MDRLRGRGRILDDSAPGPDLGTTWPHARYPRSGKIPPQTSAAALCCYKPANPSIRPAPAAGPWWNPGVVLTHVTPSLNGIRGAVRCRPVLRRRPALQWRRPHRPCAGDTGPRRGVPCRRKTLGPHSCHEPETGKTAQVGRTAGGGTAAGRRRVVGRAWLVERTGASAATVNRRRVQRGRHPDHGGQGTAGEIRAAGTAAPGVTVCAVLQPGPRRHGRVALRMRVSRNAVMVERLRQDYRHDGRMRRWTRRSSST